MKITMEYDITEALYNLAMTTTAKKDMLSQPTITIKKLADNNNILTEQVSKLTAANVCLSAHRGQRQQFSVQETTEKD